MRFGSNIRILGTFAVVIAFWMTSASCTGSDGSSGPGQVSTPDSEDADDLLPPGFTLSIEVLSGPADMVTGDNALVSVSVPPDIDATFGVTLNGRDVTNLFLEEVPGLRVALLAGLTVGPNIVTASVGGATAEATLVNHPISGPLFSGPRDPLLACATEIYLLAPADPPDCQVPTEVRWWYESTSGGMALLENSSAMPDDIAVTTVGGLEVPFIIREERGVINGAVYEIQVLDPEANETGWEDQVWNDRLVYLYSGECNRSGTHAVSLPFHESTAAVVARGYAVATASTNNFAANCSDIEAAETTLMVKEHFIETYGPPTFTLGGAINGGSGEALLIAQNYPGILDGLAFANPVLDPTMEATTSTDCAALDRFFDSAAGDEWDQAARVSVSGFRSPDTCESLRSVSDRLVDPTECPITVRDADRYNPSTNPTGIRCTVWDATSTAWGLDTSTEFARSSYDNVGIQYGLAAVNEGSIGVDQFLDLNASIGGPDGTGAWSTNRTEIDSEIAKRAYDSGRVVLGSEPLRSIPLIGVSYYPVDDPNGDTHAHESLFQLRDRLAVDPNLDDESPVRIDAQTYAIWTQPILEEFQLETFLTDRASDNPDPLQVLDKWLTDAANQDGDRVAVLSEHWPKDQCIRLGGSFHSGAEVYADGEVCNTAYPRDRTPRQVAGADSRGVALKCERIAVSEALNSTNGTYTVEFSTQQRERLRTIFPDGVCDWSQLPVAFGTANPTPWR